MKSINQKTNVIIHKLIEVYYKSRVVLKSIRESTKNIYPLNFARTFFEELLRITTLIDYTIKSYDNFCNDKFICSNDIFLLFSTSINSYIATNMSINNHVIGYNTTQDKNYEEKKISWNKLKDYIICNIDRKYERFSIYMKIILEYDLVVNQIFNDTYSKYDSSLNKLQYNTILLKLIQLNIKLKDELVDGFQNTHIYNYILRKMSSLAYIIDFGYECKKTKETIFNENYISLNQVYDILILNCSEDYGSLKTFLTDYSIYNMIELVDADDSIFSWKDLSKIINRYNFIDSINEKKYMKYTHKMYTECIEEILEEIHLI